MQTFRIQMKVMKKLLLLVEYKAYTEIGVLEVWRVSKWDIYMIQLKLLLSLVSHVFQFVSFARLCFFFLGESIP